MIRGRAACLSLLLLFLGGCERTVYAAAFTDVRNGESVEPLDLGDDQAAVLIFITVDCPVANQYSPQIRDLVFSQSGEPDAFACSLSSERAEQIRQRVAATHVYVAVGADDEQPASGSGSCEEAQQSER